MKNLRIAADLKAVKKALNEWELNRMSTPVLFALLRQQGVLLPHDKPTMESAPRAGGNETIMIRLADDGYLLIDVETGVFQQKY